jgi:hypothetical protein
LHLNFLWTIRSWYGQLHILLHQPFLISLVPSWRIDVHWRCRLEFFLDGLFVLMAWQRVVLLCLLAVLIIEEGTSLVLTWKLYLQWFRDVILQPWLLMVFRDTVGSPPLIDVCWHKDACLAVMASRHPCPCYQCARWCLRRRWK